jgi:RimJ/RimL family protein N-acetyltransferase
MDAVPTLTDGTVVLRGRVDASTWRFAVEVGGRLAGTAELRDEGEGRLEVAHESHPWVQGTGAMEKAVRLLVDWAFSDRGAAVVVWRAHTGDWASRKLAWRLGFTLEGTIRAALPQHGRLQDAWVWTLLAGDDRTPKGRWLEVPVLEGEGLRLRAWRESDVPRIVEACSDPRTQAWLGQMPAPYDESDALAWLEHQRENRARGTSVAWAVVDADDDKDNHDDVALASVSYFGLVPEVEAEIGYWAHPDARGRGVVGAAVELVVAHGFAPITDGGLGRHRLQIGTAWGNTASRHVAERAGFTLVGHFHRDGIVGRGELDDGAWYELLR